MMKKIQFLGAAGMVTGSSFLLSTETENLLIDCGLFQGTLEVTGLNYQPLAFDPRALNAVILTHAHLDHCGRLPILIKNGFTGVIYLTQASQMLVELTLLDAAKVARENNPNQILYTEEEVKQLLSHFKTVPYDQEFAVGSLAVILRDAGHILGSATVEVWDRAGSSPRHIIFSGDLGNSPEDLLMPTEKISAGDVVVMESTYGDRIHTKEDPRAVLTQECSEIAKSGGTLLIPAFSLERTQELLHHFDHLKKTGAINNQMRVYLDSPMAIAATMIYKQFKELYSPELKKHAFGDDPFDFPGLSLVESVPESKLIKTQPGAKVIIAGSGMMTGGRILHHAKEFLPLASTRLLIVGYQAVGTLGRQLLEGVKQIHIHNQLVSVVATIRKSSGMSAHADQPKLLNWLKSIKDVKQIFLIHGEDTARVILSEKIKTELQLSNIVLPKLNQTQTLDS